MHLQSETHKKVMAAYLLLQQDSISISTFENIHTLLKGFHPGIDKKLDACSKALDKLHKFQSGDVISLSAEALSEDTEEEKKRKKALLFFIHTFKDLKNEVKRVETEFANEDKYAGSHKNKSLKSWGRIIGYAKGPLAILTIAAVAVVALKSFETEIVVKNKGCDQIQPVMPFTVNIPGLVLPSQAIPSSGQAIIKIPAINITVDGTSSNSFRISGFGLHFDYSGISSNTRISFDRDLLNGSIKVLNLGSKKQHELVIACS